MKKIKTRFFELFFRKKERFTQCCPKRFIGTMNMRLL